MNDPAPKRCPFCGRKPEVEECDDGSVWVSCSDSSMKCPAYGNGAELAVWNRRPNPETQAVAWLIIHDVGHGLIEKEVVFEPYDESIPLYHSPVEAVPVKDGYRMAQVPKDMTDADIEGWRRNRALSELLKDADPLA